MDERPLVYMIVFTYFHRRISLDVLQRQNVFKHTLSKVIFSPPTPIPIFKKKKLHHFLSTHIHLYL